LNLPAGPPRAAVRRLGEEPEEPGPEVRLTKDGLLVVAGDRAWGLGKY
jgi:hypothetical protein